MIRALMLREQRRFSCNLCLKPLRRAHLGAVFLKSLEVHTCLVGRIGMAPVIVLSVSEPGAVQDTR